MNPCCLLLRAARFASRCLDAAAAALLPVACCLRQALAHPTAHPPPTPPPGGFLALDWNDSSAVGPLARRSFALHTELAETLGTDCGYRRVTTHSVAVRPATRGGGGGRRPASLPAWVDGGSVGQATVIGSTANTAQARCWEGGRKSCQLRCRGL